MGSGKSTPVLCDRRRDLCVLTKLGFHADGIDRQDIAARRVSILGHAKRYWIVQGDYLRRVYNSVSIIKRANLVTTAWSFAVIRAHPYSWGDPFIGTRTFNSSHYLRHILRICSKYTRETVSQLDGDGTYLVQMYVDKNLQSAFQYNGTKIVFLYFLKKLRICFLFSLLSLFTKEIGCKFYFYPLS